MTDHTRWALRLSGRAGLSMATVGALNVLLWGSRVTNSLISWLALLLAVSLLSFLLIGMLVFGIAYADPTSRTVKPRFWTRPLSQRHTVVAYIVIGWLAALLVVALGNYEVAHRIPTASEIRLDMLVALIGAPFISAFGAWRIASLRRLERTFRQADSTRL